MKYENFEQAGELYHLIRRQKEAIKILESLQQEGTESIAFSNIDNGNSKNVGIREQLAIELNVNPNTKPLVEALLKGCALDARENLQKLKSKLETL